MVFSDHVFGGLPLVQWRITILGNWFSFVNTQLQMGKSEFMDLLTRLNINQT